MKRRADPDETLARYRQLAAEWGPLVTTNARKANRHFDRLTKLGARLRSTDGGAEGLAQLTADDDPYVRLHAATDLLGQRPELAVRVLEGLRHDDGAGSFSAKMTLEEFRAGRLP